MTRTNDNMIESLARHHLAGNLVPFVGSGMSIPAFANWTDFVGRLAKAAGVIAVDGDSISRGAASSPVLRAEGRLASAVEAALQSCPGHSVKVPSKALRLAEIRWPLVVTTNYEAMHLAACRLADGDDGYGRLVLGRSPQHCRRVLRSLTVADQPIVWAIQGFVHTPSTTFVGPRRVSVELDIGHNRDYLPLTSDRELLSDEIVIGHAEYQRVTHSSPHFRRAFAEVVRNRSLLFLGSGLERYLLDLIAEIGELHGPSRFPSFAVYSDGDSSRSAARRALWRTHGIQPIFLSDHTKIAPFLAQLSRRIADLTGTKKLDSGRTTAWTLTRAVGPELRIERRYFTKEPEVGEVQVFSIGGRSDAPSAGRRAGEILGERSITKLGWTKRNTKPLPVWIDDGRNRLGVYARIRPNDRLRPLSTRPTHHEADNPRYWRDLRIIPIAMMAALDAVSTAGEDGGEITATIEPFATGSLRTFPAASAFTQMLKGFQRWVDANPNSRIQRVTLLLQPGHAGDGAILAALDGGRIPVSSTLEDLAVDFWIEAPIDADEVVAVPTRALPGSCLAEHVRCVLPLKKGRPGRKWCVDIEPAPCAGWKHWDLDKIGDLTLEQFGVIPGSVVRVFPHST